MNILIFSIMLGHMKLIIRSHLFLVSNINVGYSDYLIFLHFIIISGLAQGGGFQVSMKELMHMLVPIIDLT